MNENTIQGFLDNPKNFKRRIFKPACIQNKPVVIKRFKYRGFNVNIQDNRYWYMRYEYSAKAYTAEAISHFKRMNKQKKRNRNKPYIFLGKTVSMVKYRSWRNIPKINKAVLTDPTSLFRSKGSIRYSKDDIDTFWIQYSRRLEYRFDPI